MALPVFVVHKFDPFDFTRITGYPHDIPAFSIWNEYLPRFSRKEYEDPAQHLQEFKECMEQHGIIHEDVKMKLFMFSLDLEARDWFRSLPRSSISSLKYFHLAFNYSCRVYYPHKFLFEGCCEYYDSKETLKAQDNPVEENNDLVDNISSIQRSYSQINYEQVSESEELSFSQNDAENFIKHSSSIISQAENCPSN